MGEFLYEKLAVTRGKTCPKEGRVIRQMSKNSVNLEEWILLTAVGFQAMTVTETKSWESNRICGVILWCYFNNNNNNNKICSAHISTLRIQKHRGKPLLFHNKCPGTYSFTSHPKDEAIMVKCLAQGHKCRDRPGRDSNPHSGNTRTWVQCTRPLGHNTPNWLWRPRSKHVCSKCALHKNECSVGPDHFALVSLTWVVQIRLYFGSDRNRCRLSPSLVVLLQPAATELENNKLQTWQNTLGNFFSSNTLHVVWCAACIRCILGQVLCGIS